MSDTFDNPTFDVERSESKDSESQSGSPARDAMRTSQRKGQPVALTLEEAKAAFDRMDENRTGELDHTEVQEMLKSLGREDVLPSLKSQWYLIDEDDSGEIDFAAFWTWWQTDQASKGAKIIGGTVSVVSGGASVVAATMRKKKVSRGATRQRAVTPESIFVVAAGNNEGDRARAELMDKIQEHHESDFHHLEDAMIVRETAIHYHEAWETAAREKYEEGKTMKALGWSKEMFDAAKEALFSTLDDLMRSSHETESWSTTSRVKAVCVRSFFKEMTSAADGSSSPSFRRGVKKVTSAGEAAAAAKRYASDCHHELEGLLDDEELMLDDVIQVTLSSLREEQTFRQRKIDALLERSKLLGEDTPRRIRVSGLRSESAEANGVYIADGLRSSFGRPLYVQHNLKEKHHTFRLFYDMRHVKDELNVSMHQQWTDGQWVLGPTMNADRCTAFIREGEDTTQDGELDSHHEMMYPVSTAEMEKIAQHWQTYDLVTKTWREAPGDHCPGFDVRIDEGSETMQDYIGQAVQQQSRMLGMIKAQTEDSKFVSKLNAQLKKYCHRGGVRRRNYMLWVSKQPARAVSSNPTTVAPCGSYQTDL